MKKYFMLIIALIVLILLVSITYNIVRKHYVKFPTWSIDPRYEILSIDENFITLSKPIQMTNSMFFPIKLHLGAIQVTDYEGKLIALINMNEKAVLQPKSISDIKLKIALPLNLLNYPQLADSNKLDLFFDGTVQGSVYGIPFTKKMSGTFSLSPDDDWADKIFKPLLMKIMSQNKLIRFKGAKVISSKVVRLQFIASTFNNINIELLSTDLEIIYANELIKSFLKHPITLNSGATSEIIEFDIKNSEWLHIKGKQKVRFKGKSIVNVFSVDTEIDWVENIDGIQNYQL
ncbi:MAG: hypothetical protein PHY08_07570 [Candidatus Cloacimonetes bacterium]|jgi:hypothetical protein|nr:hypothetical protein [Candidatus Cloacimonadota bacterium]MDD4156412.1 hypothetical protein [Candidatus Cloacimonadota bacterium]